MASKAQRLNRKQLRASGIPNVLNFASEQVLVASAEGEIPSFNMVAYSGGALHVARFPHPVVVDLSGVEVNANAVALLDHDTSKRVGHFEEIRVEGGKIVASGRISAVNEFAQEVVASAKNGYKWHASIGARVVEASVIPAGRSVVANGRTHRGPIVLARRVKLNEVSFVGVGGDEENQVQIAASVVGEDDMKFSEWLTAKGFVEADLTADQLAVLKAAFSAEGETDTDSTGAGDADGANVQANAGGDAVSQIRAQAAAEQRRIVDVQRITRDFPELTAQAIAEGWDATRTELAVIRKERDVLRASQAPAGHVANGAGGAPADEARAIEASLGRQLGLDEETLEASYDARTLEASRARGIARIGLNELMDRTIRAAGHYVPSGKYDSQKFDLFLRAERELRSANLQATGLSTLSTSGILSNTANKILLQAFNSVNGIALELCGRRSVSDFKKHTSYRLTGDGAFTKLPPGGELKHISLQEESWTNQADTYGAMLSLDRRDIRNDDLGAFEQIPRILGRKAALYIEKTFFTLLLSNPGTYFDAGNNNYQSGAGTALSISALTAAEQLFLDRKDKDGDPILLSPTTLLVPTSLKVLAEQLMADRIVNETTTTNKPSPNSNPHAGKWGVKSSPFLNAQALSGQSSTAYYLLATPADLAGWVVSLLDGRDTPVIESSDLDFNQLGMQWRAYFDFGIDPGDNRAWVKIAGA